MLKQILILFYFLLLALQPMAQQNCTEPGQTPVSAIPVCGSEPFTITTPTYCGITNIPVPCAGGFSYQNTNPNFFRMACFSSGTLGFLITPSVATANYDWQLFDITSRNPFDIFTNPDAFVACNWSGEPGETGASDDGTALIVCAGSGMNTYSKMPQVVQGRTYLLMVANQSASGGSYQLTLTGGTASITDAIDPKMDYAMMSCDGQKITLRLNKKIVCGSIAADGSDFSLSNGTGILSATAADCSSPFGSDSIFIRLAQPLPNGNYTLRINNGTDNNTLVDVCNKNIAAGQTLAFSVSDQQRTYPDEAVIYSCAPGYVRVGFNRPIRCGSLLADGSQFSITGPQPVTVISAEALNCGPSLLSNEVILRFASAVNLAGIYEIRLTPAGSNGSTLLDECGIAPVNSSAIPFFTSSNPVSAQFSFIKNETCKGSQFLFSHNGANAVNNWSWIFGNTGTSNLQHPVYSFTAGGQHQVQLVVSNGACSDTIRQTLNSIETVKAAFETDALVCPGDTLTFKNNSTGSIDRWEWNFGNGSTNTLPQPRNFQYGPVPAETLYPITLVAYNNALNCSDTARQLVRVLNSCIIAVPTAFTPNGDGLNDFLYPLNTERAEQTRFSVYNRSGQLVYHSTDRSGKWDGKVNGRGQDAGVYVWIFSYTTAQHKAPVLLKGTTLLIR
ncbi:MAG TPA: gliding motility-associated C-terminal domain-containing protein [Chitinophagaceae bacterium]|nr:gliding motility-associated C-terminal domain-containing protein [Chitinophagaceae bacterium]